MITENLSTLKIYQLTQKQYDERVASNNIDSNALYVTPDEALDLSGYAEKEHAHEISDVNELQGFIDTSAYIDIDDNENIEEPNKFAKIMVAFATPEMYGAVGDGVADDTEAIQNACSENNRVLFGCGKNYLISETITLRSPQLIDLNNSTIKLSENVNTAFTSLNSSIGNLTIKNGTILGTRTEIPVAFTTALEEYRLALEAEGRTQVQIESLCMQYIEKVDPSIYQCGIRIPSYQSHYENLKFRNLDIGLYFDKRKNGSENALNENKVLHCKFAGCYLASFYNTSTCKNADGIMDDVTYSAGAIYGIYFGCAGGWTIQNLHMYGVFEYALCVRGMDSTKIDGLRFLGHATKITVYGGVYSSGALSNCRLTATENGSTIIHVDKNGAGSGDYFGDDRPFMLSNIIFTVFEGSKDLENPPRDITPISGNVNFVGSNIFYNDVYGSFLPNTATITDVQSGMISDYELLNTYEITESTSSIELATCKKNYRKILIMLNNVEKAKGGTTNIKVNGKSYYLTNSTSSTGYAVELELFSNNLIKISAGATPIGTTYAGWSNSVNHNGLFNVGDIISIAFASGSEATSGTVSLYAMQ